LALAAENYTCRQGLPDNRVPSRIAEKSSSKGVPISVFLCAGGQGTLHGNSRSSQRKRIHGKMSRRRARECLVTKDLGPIESRLEARQDYDEQPKRLDTDLLRKDARLKWLNPW